MLLHSYLSLSLFAEAEKRQGERESGASVAAPCPPETDQNKKKYFFLSLSFFSSSLFSPRLEQQHRVVAQVEVDKVLGLVRDVGA